MKKRLSQQYEKVMSLFLSQEVRALLDHLSAAFQAHAVFMDSEGNLLLHGREESVCRCCALLQNRPGGKERCLQLDREQCRIAQNTNALTVYTCHANLMEAISPVKIGDRCAGFVIIGQIRAQNSTPPDDFTAEEKEAFYQLPEVPPEELDARLALFSSLVDYIASRESVLLPGVRKYDLILRYIDQHLAENLTLKKLAAHAGMSVSGLTHYLRSNFQTSFKEILIEKRLSRAAQLLREYPELSVAEVAAKVGYDDEFYFSRLFHRRRGVPPGKFRNR